MRISKFVSSTLNLALSRNILLVSEDVLDVDAHVNYLDRQKRAMWRTSQMQGCLLQFGCEQKHWGK